MITGIGCATGLGLLVEVGDERDGKRLPGRVVVRNTVTISDYMHIFYFPF